MPEGWEWDATLYLGSAPFYERGRLAYAPGLGDRLAELLGLDGTGRLIDVGCGPGTVARLLAGHFDEVVGVDPDAGMLTEAARRATEAGITNIRWVQARAEELPGDLGTFSVATFAQSFHWMDRATVAEIMMEMLEPGGALVHIADVKEPRVGSRTDLPHPEPPYDYIRALVREYLGPVPRAGRGVLRFGPASGEAAIFAGAGLIGPEYLRVSATDMVVRTVDDLVAWTYSMSGSAPHLFGDRLGVFEADLRSMLDDVAPGGFYSEWPPDTEAHVWRKPD